MGCYYIEPGLTLLQLGCVTWYTVTVIKVIPACLFVYFFMNSWYFTKYFLIFQSTMQWRKRIVRKYILRLQKDFVLIVIYSWCFILKPISNFQRAHWSWKLAFDWNVTKLFTEINIGKVDPFWPEATKFFYIFSRMYCLCCCLE